MSTWSQGVKLEGLGHLRSAVAILSRHGGLVHGICNANHVM